MSSKKSIFKLSAREEREHREVQAAKRRARLTAENRASAAAENDRWAELRAWLDAHLVEWASINIHSDPFVAAIHTKKISPLAKKNIAVFVRDYFTCRDCGKTFDHPEPYLGQPIAGLTRGHIIPDSQGGTATIENLIAQCQPCNQALGARVWGV